MLLPERGLLLAALIPTSSSMTTARLVFRNTQLSLGEILKAGHKPGRRGLGMWFPLQARRACEDCLGQMNGKRLELLG